MYWYHSVRRSAVRSSQHYVVPTYEPQLHLFIAVTGTVKLLWVSAPSHFEGNMEEVSREEAQSKKARVFNRKHNFYRNTRCANVAQEEQSALPAGVINVNEDSDDDEAGDSHF